MKKIVRLVTRNRAKLEVAKETFAKFWIEVEQISEEFYEIQADTNIEIARNAALQISKKLNVPVIREDHGLFIKALAGFPGPYTNYFNRKIPVTKLIDWLKNEKNREAYFELAATYAEPNGNYKDFSFKVPIQILETPRGDKKNWDSVLKLPSSKKTISEEKDVDNLEIWNKNFVAIAEYILKR